jgi:hypothetical protein
MTNPRLALRFLILGRAAGALPTLTVTARRVARPAAGLTVPANLPLAAAEFAVTVATAATLTAANQYVEALATPFAVVPGDVVFFSVSRAASDGYASELGLLSQSGVLTAN